MTRRQIFGLVGACAGGFAGCKLEDAGVMRRAQDLAKQQDLAILGSIGVGARTIDGDSAGRLVLDACCSSRPRISPDGAWVSWIPKDAEGYPPGPSEASAFATNGVGPIRRVQLPDNAGIDVAVSSRPLRLAIRSSYGHRLGVYDADTGQLHYDVSAATTRIGIERLAISGDGSRLALGDTRQVRVVEAASSKVVFEARGRYPALSPDGAKLAFVDEGGRLVVHELDTGRNEFPMSGRKTYAVGAWSPDGTLILASIASLLPSLRKRLAIVDASGRGFADLQAVGIETDGDKYYFIKRRLLDTSKKA